MYFIQLFIALVTPNGRLSQVPFAFLCILLAVGHLWAYSQIVIQNTGITWNAYTILLFAMLWMQFCVMTRRSRDTGASGAIYVPVLAVAVIVFLVTLDPKTMWPDAKETFIGEMVMDWGMRMLRMLYVALFLYGIRAPGEEGPNGYGLEFGEVADRNTDAPRVVGKMKAHQPVHRFGQVNKNAPAWGRRKRNGFGRR